MVGPPARVVLHVGLPKTGTTWLQGLLVAHRDRLREAGVLHPFVRPGAMFHGAVEVRGSHAKFGLAAADVAGTWAALCDRARGFDGTTVLSHEVLAGATPAQVAAALAPLAGLEVHVVVTARDLGRQATAHWQEEVKLGSTWSFAELEADQLRADSGRDEGPDAGGVRPHFWHGQDFADTLRRWSSALPPERAHLVVCPAPGAPREELWRRFADACGLDAGVLDPAAAGPANPSLDAARTAHLRAVNAVLAGRLGRADHLRLVKRGYAEQVLAPASGPAPRTPAALRDVLEPPTRRWLAEVAAAGYAVHGDPDELLPVLGGPDDPHPDQPPAGADPLRDGTDDPEQVARRVLAAAGTSAEPAAGGWRRLRNLRRRGPGRVG